MFSIFFEKIMIFSNPASKYQRLDVTHPLKLVLISWHEICWSSGNELHMYHCRI